MGEEDSTYWCHCSLRTPVLVSQDGGLWLNRVQFGFRFDFSEVTSQTVWQRVTTPHKSACIRLALIWLKSPGIYSLTDARSCSRKRAEAACGTDHYAATPVRVVSMAFPEAYQGMMQQNAKHLELMMRGAAASQHTGTEGILWSFS